jgi:hypothetical protein
MVIVRAIICKHLHGLTNYWLNKRSSYRIPAFIVFASKCCHTTVYLSSVYTHNFEWFTLSVSLSVCLCLSSADRFALTSLNVSR